MKEVTDPKILEQLNGESDQKLVTDPSVLARLDVSQPQNQPSLADRMADSAAVNFLLGAGAGVQKPVYEAGNLINQMLGLRRVEPIGAPEDSTAGKIGSMAGDVAGFIGGGEALEGARLAAKGLPYAGKLAQALEGSLGRDIARRAVGGAAYGAVMSPEDRATGAAIGGISSPILDAVGAIGGKTLSAIKPSEVVTKLKDILSPSSVNERKDIGSKMFKNIFDQLPKGSIYDGVMPQLAREDGKIPFSATYKDLTQGGIASPAIEEFIPSKLRMAHDNFMNNPTAENAHLLYKQYGAQIGKYNTMEAKSGTIDAVNNALRDTFGIGRDAIKRDLSAYMSAQNPELFKQFLDANQHYQRNVYPYEQLSIALRSLGDKASPQKILNTLTKKESLASDIGERTGREQYFPQEVSEALPQLEKRIQAQNLAQRGAGLLLGGALGAHFAPTMELASLAGGVGGAYLAPTLTKMMGKVAPSGQLVNKGADFLKKALIASLINRGQ